MLVNLKTSADHGLFEIDITDRIPSFIEKPCRLICEYHIQRLPDYCLLTCAVSTLADHPLTVICQRCLSPFQYPYTNTTTMAICKTEEQALQLMDDYICLVAENNQLDFTELVTDDLYLYVPESHPDFANCDEEVSKYINS